MNDEIIIRGLMQNLREQASKAHEAGDEEKFKRLSEIWRKIDLGTATDAELEEAIEATRID